MYTPEAIAERARAHDEALAIRNWKYWLNRIEHWKRVRGNGHAEPAKATDSLGKEQAAPARD